MAIAACLVAQGCAKDKEETRPTTTIDTSNSIKAIELPRTSIGHESSMVIYFTVFADREATVTDIGGSTLAAPFAYAGGKPFPGDGGTCEGSLHVPRPPRISLPGAPPNPSCKIAIQFAPTAEGAKSETLKVSFKDDVGAARDVSLEVLGVGERCVDNFDLGNLVMEGDVNAYTYLTTSDDRMAQAFSSGVGRPITLDYVTLPLKMKDAGDSLASVTLAVRKSCSDVPCDTDLAKVTRALTTLGQAKTYVTFAFDPPVMLSVSTAYFWVLSAVLPSGSELGIETAASASNQFTSLASTSGGGWTAQNQFGARLGGCEARKAGSDSSVW